MWEVAAYAAAIVGTYAMLRLVLGARYRDDEAPFPPERPGGGHVRRVERPRLYDWHRDER